MNKQSYIRPIGFGAILLVIASFPWALVAQDTYIKFDRMTTQNGLPQDHVFCIFQDDRGFLWLGMETGLARYDGYTFKVYQHDPTDSTSISSNIIKAIHQDKKGYLWIGTDGEGICRFDPKLEQFITFKNEPDNLNSLSGNRIYSIAEDQVGAIWVATLGNGLNRMVISKETANGQQSAPKITRFQFSPDDPNSLSSNNIWTILLDKSNRLWIGTVTGGLNMLNLESLSTKGAVFHRFLHDANKPSSISGNSIKSICQDGSGTIWVGTEFHGLNQFGQSSKKFNSYNFEGNNPFSLSHNHVNAIFEDDQGRLWVGTNGGGLNLFDRITKRFTRYQHTASDPYSLNGNLINTIYQDNAGTIWIGLVIKGLSWIDPQKQLTRHYYPVEGNPNSLNGNLAKAIYEDQAGKIWIGTYGGGLSLFDPTTGSFNNFWRNPATGNSNSVNNVQTILEDHEGVFWIGTDGGGLQLFDRQSKNFSAFNQSPSGKSRLFGNSVWAICEDIRGNLWIGTADGGLNFFDRQQREFIHFTNDPNNPNGINSNDIRTVFEDHLGILWIGTYGGGLNRYNPANQQFIHYQHIPNDANSISSDIITTIFESAHTRQLWVGTFGGGLNRFDRVSESFEAFREKDGLPNDVVKSIEEDNDGNLWVSTLKGISQFNPNHKTVVNYSLGDGLQAEFNLGSSCVTKDGAMFFGGTNGFNVFHPNEIKKIQDASAPCLITDLKIFNHSVQPGEKINNRIVLKETINEAKEIVIPHTIDDFAFEFATLDFVRSDKIEYSFQLEGVEEDWQNTSAQLRYAPYSNLDAGEYLFKVRATNKDGTWNGQVTQLKVTVLTSPWKTTWAYGLYALFFLGLIYFARHYEIGRMKLFNELKLERLKRKKVRELNEMKLKFFTNISHEIRTPLTLILGPLESLITKNIANLETRNQLQTMHRNANKLLSLVNQLLEFRKQESGHTKLKVVKCDFVGFMKEIILYFQEFAHQKNIDFKFTHDSTSIPLWFDPSQLEKVFFNLLSNAFKFTPQNGMVKVHAFEENKVVKVYIDDNGKGISSEDLPYIFDRFHKFEKDYSGNYLGSGIGLALTKGLIELHSGSIEVESEPEKLTRFKITLQKGIKHFQEDQIESDFKNSEDAAHYQLANVKQITAVNTFAKEEKENAPKLLIVEDNLDVRNYLEELFQHEYQIMLAADGKEGFALALEHSPNLILSDIMMPEMDGIEFCRNIKTSIETSHIPVILLTARTALDFRAEGLETGADDYITKPFNPKLLKIRVKNLVESREKVKRKIWTSN